MAKIYRRLRITLYVVLPPSTPRIIQELDFHLKVSSSLKLWRGTPISVCGGGGKNMRRVAKVIFRYRWWMEPR